MLQPFLFRSVLKQLCQLCVAAQTCTFCVQHIFCVRERLAVHSRVKIRYRRSVHWNSFASSWLRSRIMRITTRTIVLFLVQLVIALNLDANRTYLGGTGCTPELSRLTEAFSPSSHSPLYLPSLPNATERVPRI